MWRCTKHIQTVLNIWYMSSWVCAAGNQEYFTKTFLRTRSVRKANNVLFLFSPQLSILRYNTGQSEGSWLCSCRSFNTRRRISQLRFQELLNISFSFFCSLMHTPGSKISSSRFFDLRLKNPAFSCHFRRKCRTSSIPLPTLLAGHSPRHLSLCPSLDKI